VSENLNNDELVALAREVLDIESRAVNALRARLDDDFATACRLINDTPGRVVVTGMGKSGHISSKIAATLASTGTPAFFMHPAEASHGDLGMITENDLVLAISYSGETAEVVTILPLVKRMGAKLISMTGNPKSTLARIANVHLNVAVSEEACPLNLAPTASTTATLAMGDALAVALLKNRGFTAEDFARSHPSGSLGKRLLLRVGDVMRTGEDIPAVGPEVRLRDGLMEMTQKGLRRRRRCAHDVNGRGHAQQLQNNDRGRPRGRGRARTRGEQDNLTACRRRQGTTDRRTQHSRPFSRRHHVNSAATHNRLAASRCF
jgi:arabinose-5-phosphate isomerase